MTRMRPVPDDVWWQLDPSAGRLSRHERRVAVVVGIALVTALVLAVLGYVSGAAYPRVNGDMTAARGDIKTRVLHVGVKISNPGWVGQHISSITIDDPSITVIHANPSDFTLPADASLTVHLRLHITDCTSRATDTPLPVAVVVPHWWGHESHVLFSDHGNSGYMGVAGMACPGG